MGIFAISDLHLSFGIKSKPMDIFGNKWVNYIEKLKINWENKIKDEDYVLIAGDFSWATYLEETKEDFKFLNDLPGKKILLKGNHDYWWTTLKKMNEFIDENQYNSVKFLYNNAIDIGNYIVCGTRYWSNEEEYDNEKIINRECERAKLSLKTATQLADKPIIFMTHYPPDGRIIKSVEDFNIKYWIYGHIHSNYEENIIEVPGIKTCLTSCDYLEFDPLLIE